MKIILFIILLSFSLGEIYQLARFGLIKTKQSSGLIYLNIEKFKIDEKIHIEFSAINGKINNEIKYEFTNFIPDDSYEPSFLMIQKFESTIIKSIRKYSFSKNYYYDIIKNTDLKYLIIKYTKAEGEYLEIKNTVINNGFILIFFLILIFVFVFIILIMSIICKIYKKIKLAQLANRLQSYYFPNQIIQNIQNMETGIPYNTNNNNPPQGNLYYIPSAQSVFISNWIKFILKLNF